MMLCLCIASLFAFGIVAIAFTTYAWTVPPLVLVVFIVATYFAPKVRAWLKKERTVAHEGVEKILDKKE